jgi:hypothetical protein
MKIASNKSSRKISGIEITNEIINGRGGLSLVMRYLDSLGILARIENQYGHFRKSSKGDPIGELVRQIMAYFINGDLRAISGFDSLRNDNGYAAILERSATELIGSAKVKRFFKKFNCTGFAGFRSILNDMFIWRLKTEKPGEIVLHIDTMVLDNDDAQKREGVEPTYKQVCGYQPLQINWGPYIIDVNFRSGEKHSNHGNDAKEAVNRIVKLIRERYDAKIPIIICADSGFLSDENLCFFEDELKVHYVVMGKLYQSIYSRIEELDISVCAKIDRGDKAWNCCDFKSKLDSWNKERRTILTSLLYNDDQYVLEGIRDTVIYTNLGNSEQLDNELKNCRHDSYLTTIGIVGLAHHNGQEELNHRSIKDFIGSEHLPFKRFGMNGAYYLLMVISHFLMEAFRMDVAFDKIPIRCYPARFRREIIDFAVKIIYTGRKYIMKATNEVWNRLNLSVLWQKCNCEPVWS